MRPRLFSFVLCALLFCSGVSAQTLTPAATAAANALTFGDNAEKVATLKTLTDQPDPALLPLLEALAADALYAVEGTEGSPPRWLIVDEAGQAVDALTGQAAELPADAVAVTINNRVRGALALALAAQRLSSPDDAQRRAAIDALREAPTPALMPLLETALQKESVSSIRQRIAVVRAMIQLEEAPTDPATRLAAMKTLGETSDPAIRQLLEPWTQHADTALAKAARAAISDIDFRLTQGEVLGQLFTGLSLASILLLAALGLAVVYGLMGVINMAHGELILIGAYATYVVQALFRQYLPGAFDWYPLAALPVAFLAAALVGIALERLVIRHLYGRPLETLLATWGISLILIQAARMIFGAQNVAVENPAWLSGGIEVFSNLTLPYNRLAIIAFAVTALVAVWLLLARTRLGLFVRAVTQNRPMARALGVATGRVDALTFGLGAGLAGLAGCALSQVGNVGPELGQGYIVDSFMVVVLGGVGQLAGTVYAALGVGVLSKVLEGFSGAVLAKIFILIAVIAFIQKRPQGIFALKGRFADA
ncbi:MAG: urea ABC transporter permease subunit UrtB [Zoogloeaceae bacterium]|jgi:urea transport system permease protein|nr:urea ABC transporter permease subunit UrtB [Zoogloeaceae bacterium]